MTLTLILNWFAGLMTTRTAPVVTVQMPTVCRCCGQRWSAAQCTTEWAREEFELGQTCQPCVEKFWEGF